MEHNSAQLWEAFIQSFTEAIKNLSFNEIEEAWKTNSKRTEFYLDSLLRDQVWLIEKDDKGASTLFRSSEIQGLRKNTPIDKWYLSGRLGGTPVIMDQDFLIEVQNQNMAHERG